MAPAQWPSATMLMAAAVLAVLAAGVAALVPWLSAPPPLRPRERDPDTPVVVLRDGRNVSYSVFGDPQGKHLSFWFHGTPSCRLEAHGLSEEVLKQLSLKMIAFDRPGYGQSDPHPSRTYATFADDVAQMADAFGAKQFSVAGASGGGPYALATTYYLPERVLSTVVHCAAGSWGALNETERAELPLSKRQQKIIRALTTFSKRAWFRWLLSAVYAIPRVQRFIYEQGLKGWVRAAASSMTDGDMECLHRPPEYWINYVRPESTRQQTATPWVQDHVLFFDDWAFDISTFPKERQERIHIAHGLSDKIVHPVFSSALKRRMPHAHLELVPGGGHVDFYICSKDFQRRMFEAMVHSAKLVTDW